MPDVLSNQLEPAALIEHFKRWPPDGFSPLSIGLVPAFATQFDLLTTLDERLRRLLERLLPRRVRAMLQRPAVFVGTTVSEFALLPADDADAFIARVLHEHGNDCDLIIVKDMPASQALICESDFAATRRIARACVERGFTLISGQALAYVPIDFASRDEFLRRMSRARRKNIRRKLRSAAGIEVERVLSGDKRFDEPEFVARLYQLYENVYEQSDIHFDRLTAAFFSAVLRDSATQGIVFLYRLHNVVIGFNLCFRFRDMLVDKYIGFAYPEAREHNLYAISWFENLDYAAANRLRHYVAGWTDPQVKRELGAQFVMTQHAVYLRNAFLRGALRALRRLFEPDRRWERDEAAAHS